MQTPLPFELLSVEDTLEDNPSKDVRLAKLPPGMQALPRIMANSAIFAVSNTGRETRLNNEVISSTADHEVTMTGWSLDQSDLHVFSEVVSMGWFLLESRSQGQLIVEIDPAQYLTRSSHRTGFYYEKVKSSLTRLAETNITIYKIGPSGRARKYFVGSLFAGVTFDKTWRVELTGTIVKMLAVDEAFPVDPTPRLSMRSQLETWLLNHFDSQPPRSLSQPFHYFSVSAIMQLCGSRTKAKGSFVQKLKLALERLEDAKHIAEWDVKGDIMLVRRDPTAVVSPRPEQIRKMNADRLRVKARQDQRILTM